MGKGEAGRFRSCFKKIALASLCGVYDDMTGSKELLETDTKEPRDMQTKPIQTKLSNLRVLCSMYNILAKQTPFKGCFPERPDK